MSRAANSSEPAWASALPAAAEELFPQCDGQRFGITIAGLRDILHQVGCKYLSPSDSPAEARRLFAALHLQELVLARACASGHEAAWETFLLRYREKLYSAAYHIAREDSAARELADSLYADLFGTAVREGKRVCKLDFYTGRGSLEGWLRTVLAQEYINRYRTQKRLVSLEEQAEAGEQYPAPADEPQAAVDARLPSAVDEALRGLTAEERFLLASYYLDQRTLAEVGRALGIHASNVSRRLEKLASGLGERIRNSLQKQGLDRRQAEELMTVDVRDLQVNIRAHLAQKPSPKPFSEQKAEAHSGEGEG
ncbi:MAG TPA: sigma-70 family RNA polymerase sigma factor [Terriglobales bacterium]|nr:sigma-70 family RNA polymerase sigma factor [Terriglobales bacterium]